MLTSVNILAITLQINSFLFNTSTPMYIIKVSITPVDNLTLIKVINSLTVLVKLINSLLNTKNLFTTKANVAEIAQAMIFENTFELDKTL